ncbi:hypothetical protein PP175_25315 (plasmid) [Aneurinibacillus sp. Ricciae_BoGa-3]|uniref:hypothetical protein n=1 Tax=Aneurinibacillus sp. Ricciae_BoGa-3 TaxID=3022697 RepID=UPI002341B26C|nr:hypothetical protein [Aneurinibacillus sp. Ricciae_BoGa-3]WCK57389.1 hypothetical protein PP175_25315 [Aneurinibacillus sp. Ricciae_BoGa-3]
MASKPKSRTYIMHHRGRAQHGGFTVLGRYKVGARNEKEAETFLREVVGKHAKVSVYYEETIDLVHHRSVIQQSGIKRSNVLYSDVL